LNQIARSFVTARKTPAVLAEYPGDIPESFADAYSVQDLAISLFDEAIAGWKVGKIAPAQDGVDRLAGPIFVSQIIYETTGLPMKIFGGGFAAAEAEFLLRVGPSFDPGKSSYTIEEAMAALDAVHVGIEIASSPFPGINECGPMATISDFGNNNGLVIGAAIEDWRSAGIVGWPVELSINGEQIGAATAATMLDGPFGAARFLFELSFQRGRPLKPGDWISSGAVTGVHEVRDGDEIEARFGARFVTRCTVKNA
jgi:2-keto-4-pentenoate hydratase